MYTEPELLNERLERLAMVLDEIMPNCALLVRDALELLKKQEVRELTIEEWQEWKKNQKRNPICILWENDTSPMWILNPNDVHEPALLIGKLKLFTGKPTFQQCKAVKWNDKYSKT